jgi:hypothetical protein
MYQKKVVDNSVFLLVNGLLLVALCGKYLRVVLEGVLP